MFSKTITYEDFNGEQTTKVFYFHMSKAELLEMAASGNEMMARIQRIIDSKDGKGILEEFRVLVESACGIKSEDGQRFIKSPEAKSQLLDSPAFDELLMELCTEADASAEFVRQLIPAKMQKEMRDQLAKNANPSVAEVMAVQKANLGDRNTFAEDLRPVWMKEDRNPTQQELMNMSPAELRLAFQHRAK